MRNTVTLDLDELKEVIEASIASVHADYIRLRRDIQFNLTDLKVVDVLEALEENYVKFQSKGVNSALEIWFEEVKHESLRRGQ